MLVRTTGVVLLALLAACTPESQDAVARESAKSVVNPILAERFPGLPVSLATDCVIDNATTQEIVTLASGALTGVTPQTIQTTNTILARRGTIECMTNAGLAALLSGGL